MLVCCGKPSPTSYPKLKRKVILSETSSLICSVCHVNWHVILGRKIFCKNLEFCLVFAPCWCLCQSVILTSFHLFMWRHWCHAFRLAFLQTSILIDLICFQWKITLIEGIDSMTKMDIFNSFFYAFRDGHPHQTQNNQTQNNGHLQLKFRLETKWNFRQVIWGLKNAPNSNLTRLTHSVFPVWMQSQVANWLHDRIGRTNKS